MKLIFHSGSSYTVFSAVSESQYTGIWQTLLIEAEVPQATDSVTIVLEGLAGTVVFDDVSLDEMKVINKSKQLFFDDFVVKEYTADRRIHVAQKYPSQLIQPEYGQYSWEESAYIYGSVLYEGGIYKMWYRAINTAPFASSLCFAWSVDGVVWNKSIPQSGFSDNRCVINGLYTGSYGLEIASVTKAGNKYYMIGYNRTDFINSIYSTFVSDDGYTWNILRFSFIDYSSSGGIFSDVGGMYYEPDLSRYLIWTKDGCYNRVFSFCRSQNLITHSPLVTQTVLSEGLMDFVNLADDDYAYYRYNGPVVDKTNCYGLGLFKVHDMYVGFNWQFAITADSSCGADDGLIDVQLFNSRNPEVEIQRPFRTPVVERSHPPGWDSKMLATASSPVYSPDSSEVWLYYSGWNTTHGAAPTSKIASIGLAKWRRDGFVSMSAGSDPATVITKKILCNSDYLVINAKTINTAISFITAEISDENGNPIPGFENTECIPFTGDYLSFAMAWQGGNMLSDLKGLPVQITFYLYNADLFSFGFSNTVIEIPTGMSSDLVAASDADVLLSPNPALDRITIYGLSSDAYVEVMTLTGSVVGLYSIDRMNAEMSVNDLPPGVYLLRITMQDGVVRNKKLIIER